MPSNLEALVVEQKNLSHSISLHKTSATVAMLKQRLHAIKERLRKFGQRYSIIQVTVIFSQNNTTITKIIYYTDISESDAINYTKILLEVNFKVVEIMAITIPVGKLQNIVI